MKPTKGKQAINGAQPSGRVVTPKPILHRPKLGDPSTKKPIPVKGPMPADADATTFTEPGCDDTMSKQQQSMPSE